MGWREAHELEKFKVGEEVRGAERSQDNGMKFEMCKGTKGA